MRFKKDKFISGWWILGLIVLVGGFLRFYKLDWGEGYFFHPDEYRTIASINQLAFPSQMNPHFFQYGSFVVYLRYFTKLIFEVLNFKFLDLNPFLIGRFYSALFSTLTIPLIFFLSEKLLRSKHYSYLATFLVATMPGLIQQAHFATPESILTFWLFLALFLGIVWLEKEKLKFLYLSAVCLGLALATKIAVLSFLPILAILPSVKIRFRLIKKPVFLVKLIILPLFIALLTFLFISPYTLLDWQEFHKTINYEAGLGWGKPVVFYTRQFIQTTPIVSQYQKIFPYTLGAIVIFFGTLGFLTVLVETFQAILNRKKEVNYKLLIFLSAFLVLFLPNAFLFTKWTRFVAPVFPFFAIFTAYFILAAEKLFKRSTTFRLFFRSFVFLLLAISLIWSLMFFSIYRRPDVRLTASSWINSSLPLRSFILVESGNTLDLPLEGSFQRVSFDFYHLDETPKLQKQLPELLAQADYFIVQSRRIFANHQRLPEQFPKTTRFYDLLFSEQFGFEKIKEFDSYPQLWFFKIPDESAEETWSVFDHPVIRIYKKTRPLSREAYEKILQI